MQNERNATHNFELMLSASFPRNTPTYCPAFGISGFCSLPAKRAAALWLGEIRLRRTFRRVHPSLLLRVHLIRDGDILSGGRLAHSAVTERISALPVSVYLVAGVIWDRDARANIYAHCVSTTR